MSEVKTCGFKRLFLFDSYLLNFVVKNVWPKVWSSDYEMIYSVDQIHSALEHSNVGLPFFIHTVCLKVEAIT